MDRVLFDGNWLPSMDSYNIEYNILHLYMDSIIGFPEIESRYHHVGQDEIVQINRDGLAVRQQNRIQQSHNSLCQGKVTTTEIL